MDAEYKLGAQIMPRVGAVVFLLGMAFLVALAVARGLITKELQFAGELLLCALFVGVGLKKLNEREDFGQVLVGIGSCGLYFSLAGAQSAKHILTGEGLVVGFTALGLANLGFSWWRGSKSFLGIGMVGGLVGALMPLDRSAWQLSLTLHAIIALSVYALVARHKWSTLLPAVWLACAMSSAFITASRTPELVSVGLWMVGAIVPIAVLAWIARTDPVDEQLGAVLAPAVGLLTAATWVPGSYGLGATLVFGGALLALSVALRSPLSRQVQAAAVAVAAIVAPATQPAAASSLLYSLVAMAASVVSCVRSSRPAAALGVAALVCGLFAYVPAAGGELDWAQEVPILALAMVAMVSVTEAVRRTGLVSGMGVVGAALVGIVWLRFCFVVFSLGALHWPQDISLTVGALFFSALLAGFGIMARRSAFPALAWVYAACAAWAYFMVAASDVPPQADITLVVALMTLVGLCAYASGQFQSDDSPLFAAALGLWVLFTRLVYVVLTLPTVGVGEEASITIAWTVYGFALIVVGFARNLKMLRVFSFSVFGLTLAKVLFVDLASLDPAIRVGVLLGLGGAMLAGGYWFVRAGSKGA